jgi:hypothetical protein
MSIVKLDSRANFKSAIGNQQSAMFDLAGLPKAGEAFCGNPTLSLLLLSESFQHSS